MKTKRYFLFIVESLFLCMIKFLLKKAKANSWWKKFFKRRILLLDLIINSTKFEMFFFEIFLQRLNILFHVLEIFIPKIRLNMTGIRRCFRWMIWFFSSTYLFRSRLNIPISSRLFEFHTKFFEILFENHFSLTDLLHFFAMCIF